jgi:hypothetical protein
MLPISVDARAKINVTFLHAPERSFAVSCRLLKSAGAAAVRLTRAVIVVREIFIVKDNLREKKSV